RWFGWYVGPGLVVAAIGGLLLIRDAALGRAREAVAFLAALVALTSLYVWNPAITPDQIWAMRRYLPITIPGLMICAFWLVDRLVRRRLQVVAVVAALAVIAYPAWILPS